MKQPSLYDDGRIVCGEDGLVIRWYYPWGAKRISYGSIKKVTQLSLTGANRLRRWRIWGSGDFVHWWNLDPSRPRKTVALVLELGGRVRPTITPNEPFTVERIIEQHLPA